MVFAAAGFIVDTRNYERQLLLATKPGLTLTPGSADSWESLRKAYVDTANKILAYKMFAAIS